MSSIRRRKPRRSLDKAKIGLDLFVENGAIERPDQEFVDSGITVHKALPPPDLYRDALNVIHKLKKGKRLESLSDQEKLIVNFLVVDLLGGPVRPDSRRVSRRNYWIAAECAYYKSLGDSAFRKKTAENWGEKARTVTRAMNQHSARYRNPKKQRDEDLKDMLEAARDAYGGPGAKSKYRDKRRMDEHAEREGHKLH